MSTSSISDPKLSVDIVRSNLELAQSVKAGLSQMRQLLIHAPTSLSIVNSGPRLESISLDLIALNAALTESPDPELLQQVLEIQALSGRVVELHRQAANFMNGLAAESIKNGAWDAASYAPDGEWAAPATVVSSRIRIEG